MASLNELAAPHSVRIGNRAFPFSSFEQVSAAYRSTIEAMGLGGSQTPRCDIFDGAGQKVAHVSYNGRVWNNEDLCLYDPIINPTYPAKMAPGAVVNTGSDNG